MSVRRMNSNDGALHLRSRNRGGICGCNVGTICLHISVGATGTWPGPRADICAAMHANRYDGDVGLRLLCITSSSLPSTWPKWCTDALPCEEGDARRLASLFADACITCGTVHLCLCCRFAHRHCHGHSTSLCSTQKLRNECCRRCGMSLGRQRTAPAAPV